MITNPDVLSDLARFREQDRLREVERWRLAREARPHGAKFWGAWAKLVLHWFWLRNLAAGAGQGWPRLAAWWRLK